MTDQEKIELMDELLHDVLHSLDMTIYHIDDPGGRRLVADELDKYWERFADIHPRVEVS